MNALYVIYKYLEIKRGTIPQTPITVIFGAKAAPAYVIAKDIIHLILCLQEIVNNDPDVNPYLNVVMVENYNVTLAEKLIPACDISEQISLASKEASGTGNMKFMLNGAVTLGTEDGANVEIHQFVGDENIYIFGAESDAVIEHYEKADYKPSDYYKKNPKIQEALDFITGPQMLKVGEKENLERLSKELKKKDWFMTFLDLESYIETKDRAMEDYRDREAWAKKMLYNISNAGFFSSDRTIYEYNRDIWKLEARKMRKSGILMPVFSLPSRYGIGSFSKEAYEFVDFLKAAGQSCWQVLPMGPTSYGDSPYQSFSTFAGNPYFISLEDLIEEGVLTEKECDAVDFGSREDDVDYEKIYKGRYKLLRKAYERSDISKNPDFVRFQQEQAHWLGDYALFMAVKDRFEGIPWTEWAEDIRLRWNNALDYYRKELYFEIEFQEYMQFKFYEQWAKLKAYANRRGIRIIGDIPIYVAMDSADTWANPGLFKLDENNEPTQVAGCPPDGFSATGQLWGNPLYRWDVHKNTGFEWWIKRLAHCFNMYDVVRIDHFRGLESYWEIPADSETALNGKWVDGPKDEFFEVLIKTFGEEPPIIAEDLGIITDDVRALRDKFGLPGMKILQFAFEDEDSNYLPYNQPYNCVCYTGTHDNDTTTGWYATASEKARDKVRRYMNTDASQVSWDFIRTCFGSPARFAIIPVQDLFCQGSDCRMNTPGKADGNWAYRMKKELLTSDVAKRLYDVTKLYGR